MLPRSRRLQILLGGAAALTILALVGIALTSIRAVADSHRTAAQAARADLEALEDAAQLEGLLRQRGLTCSYFLYEDPRFLADFDKTRPAVDAWFAALLQRSSSPAWSRAVADLTAEYGRYDADRERAIELWQAGDREGAKQLLAAARRGRRVAELAHNVVEVGRGEVRAGLEQADRQWQRSLVKVGVAFGVACLGVLIVMLVLAQRIRRPLIDLVERARSAGEPDAYPADVEAGDEFGALAVHLQRLSRQLEESTEALSEHRIRLVQAEKMSALGEMATAVAHEVLNPLTGVKMALQLLARREASPASIETAAAVDEEIRRVEALAQRLLSFARPLTPQRRTCSLPDLFGRLLEAARTAVEQQHIRLEFQIDGRSTVEADPELLEQLLLNLTLNACQAVRDGGSVRVGARPYGRGRLIEVTDDGAGLSPEVERRLFTPFVTTRPEGHGLGLAISQNIALAHGGRIEARSNAPAPGTTFSVWLPEARA